MDFSGYIREYRERSYCLTDKQKQYILALSRSVDDSIRNDDIPKELFVSILNHPVTAWTDLTKDDVSILIKTLLTRVRLSVNQRKELERLYPDESTRIKQINDRLHRSITSLDDLSVRDYRFLIKTPDRFHLIPIDFPLKCEEEYEYGYQQSTHCANGKMYYLKFYNLMMLDYDAISLDQLKQKLFPFQERFRFRIYVTCNGFHVFIISCRIPHRICFDLMKALECDPYYTLFSYKYGYKIRLSPKLGRSETFLAQLVEEFGQASPEPELMELMDLHDRFIGMTHG